MTISQDVLVQFSPNNAIIGVAGYFVAPENTQHAICGNHDGKLIELYWKCMVSSTCFSLQLAR